MINFFFGLLSGVFTGLGVGGGVFLIMLLSWTSAFSQLEIQTINLIYYIPTAIFSIWVYSKEKNIDFKVGIKIVSVAVITAVFGATLAHKIDVNLLRRLFGVYLTGIRVFFLIPKDKGKPSYWATSHKK